MIAVETDSSDDWDSRTDWSALAERAARAAAAQAGQEALTGEVSILFTSDAEVRALNAAWRQKDMPTNVLSFPMAAPDELADAAMLGDIVLAHGVCAREAAAKPVAIETHAAHLVVHGMLHLLGYDHETGEAEAEEMEQIERLALARLGIADPYQVSEVQS